MLLHKVVFEDIIRTKYKPGTGIMAAIKILRIEGNWGRRHPCGVVCGEGVSGNKIISDIAPTALSDYKIYQ